MDVEFVWQCISRVGSCKPFLSGCAELSSKRVRRSINQVSV
jgi:hypothetical protein